MRASAGGLAVSRLDKSQVITAVVAKTTMLLIGYNKKSGAGWFLFMSKRPDLGFGFCTSVTLHRHT